MSPEGHCQQRLEDKKHFQQCLVGEGGGVGARGYWLEEIKGGGGEGAVCWVAETESGGQGLCGGEEGGGRPEQGRLCLNSPFSHQNDSAINTGMAHVLLSAGCSC